MKGTESQVRTFVKQFQEELSKILQNRLLDESGLIRFARHRGIGVSGVVTGDPSRFLELGWLKSDELSDSESPLFHPFRIYPLHLAVESCRLNISPSSSINRETFGEFLLKIKDFLPSLDRVMETTAEANEITDLAILLEPIYWPIITSRTTWNEFIEIEEYQKLVEAYKAKIFDLVCQLNVDEWRKRHENLRIKSAQLDDNGDIYILLRLSPWIKRERLKGPISAALWFRHMAELLRRGFKDVHEVNWPEEDQAFGQWFPGARERIYGSDYPTDDPIKARPHVAFEFGLHTGSTLRWYLEGETEYYAALYILPRAAAGGIELVNLKGAVGSERANAALRLADCLRQDKELHRFSFISFDTDVTANVKSTALRHVTGNLHPSKYRVIYVTATSGSILELYRQIINEMGIDITSNSRALLTKTIKQEVLELSRGKKMKVVLVIDEASLLRLPVFAELHTLAQFENDSKPFLPLILAGQNNLVENLRFRDSLPLASRVVAKKHLQGVDREAMETYLDHHLNLAGVKISLFEEGAVTAVHQGAGGLFRKANHLARGSIIAAAKSEKTMVTAEHVRLAATELL